MTALQETRLARPSALTHVGVTVTDLEKAIRWYSEVFGLRLIAGPVEMVADGSHYGQMVRDIFGAGFRKGRLVLLSGANGVAVELFEFDEPKSERRDQSFDYWKSGVFHICFVEPDIEAKVQEIAATGGRLRTRVWQLSPDKPYKLAFCEDPFGNIIELYSHSSEQIWSNQA